MKACPNAAILRLFHSCGVHFDCSSGYEVIRALLAGIPPTHLSLSSQELARVHKQDVRTAAMLSFEEMIQRGVHFNACSAHQVSRTTGFRVHIGPHDNACCIAVD
jgi:diaminopimelate decarboxylase